MKKDLIINGKKFISSKRAAEITGYTCDYVGQLSRLSKIEATMVGRSWYVGEESILSHHHENATANSFGRRAKKEVVYGGKKSLVSLQKTAPAEVAISTPVSDLKETTKIEPKKASSVSPYRYGAEDHILVPEISSKPFSSRIKKTLPKALSKIAKISVSLNPEFLKKTKSFAIACLFLF